MYLKRLQIQGFKSFALSTTFELTPGVTCIAGPNGAGKTNVADAVRWVLGEQASRVIRARKTEDIIFSGSDKRAAMGMAEVKITLDNADGWLPIDFDEVVVGRRAYRSGDNEYLLNNSKVRLRDIQELFMKAHVGQNSYAFMGQGLVEQVLTLRPEDRRAMIEEAADVRLHRDKLDKARTRLKATLDNLASVEMLTKELAPRIRQLERQANRAAIHERLSTELAQALRALYGQQWQDAQEALAAARATCDQRQEAFERVQRETNAAEEGLTSLGSAFEERQRDLAAREDALRALVDYRRDLERRITTDEERSVMAEQRRQELLAEIASLRGERDQLTSIVEQQANSVTALDEQIAGAEQPETAGLDEIDGRLAELRQALAGHQGALTEADGRVATAEGRLRALTEQTERSRADLAEAQEARRQVIPLLREWGRDVAEKRSHSLELAPKAEQAERELRAAQQRVDELSAAVSSREIELRAIALEIDAIEARLDPGKAIDVEMPPPDAGVRALFAAAGMIPGEKPDAEKRIEGIVGMVGQILHVPEGLERAIEAALTDSVHAVVVETQEDALAASELLLTEDLGRAIIYPLSGLHSVPAVNLQRERGVVGVASELVRFEPRFRPLVEALLGHTIVAENMGIARSLLRRGLGSVVTRDGVLLRPLGSIAAGSAQPIQRALTRQRDTAGLRAQLERLRDRQRDTANAQRRDEQALKDARSTRDRLAPELSQLRAERQQADEELRVHRGRLSPIAARLATLHARIQTATSAIAAQNSTEPELRSEIDAATAEASEHREAAERLRSEVDALFTEREAKAREAATQAARIAGLESARESLHQQHEVQTAALERTENEIARREELTEQLASELQTIVARLEATKQELATKSQETESATNELVPARAALDQMRSRQRTINDEMSAARSRSLAAERALLEAQSTVRLREEEIQSLKERLEEEGFRPGDDGDIEPAAASPAADVAVGGPPAWLKEPDAAEPAGEDAPPPMRGATQVDAPALKARISKLRAEIRNLGPVNEQASTDYEESRERYEFLTTQVEDLRKAEASLQDAIAELEGIIKERFSTTFNKVNEKFSHYFQTFFGGGQAELLLTEPDDDGLVGVDIVAQPPRKRVKSLNMLSGGERSLTAVAMLFALLQINPSPIVVLDEVDAALDEANVDRFTQTLRELAERSQFVIITHNRRTLEMADTIYGVSMGEDSTSSVLSLRVGDIDAQ